MKQAANCVKKIKKNPPKKKKNHMNRGEAK